MPTTASVAMLSDSADARMTRVRWWICGLLLFSTTINYVDRQVIGVLKPQLQATLGWDENDFATVVASFQAAYALGYLFAGRLIDLIGVRIGLPLAVALWSIAAMAHASVRSVLGFSIVRFALGLAEGGNFPASIKTVAEWFPRRQRALATGIFNAGSNLGPLLTPIVVPWITVKYGLSAAFIATGALGFVWLIAWVAIYRSPENHSHVSARELTFIRSDVEADGAKALLPLPVPGERGRSEPVNVLSNEEVHPSPPPSPRVQGEGVTEAAAKISWLRLLRQRQTWVFVVGTLFTSPVWWFYLFWIPGFLNKRFSVDLLKLGPPLVVIYLMADVGSIGGGWLSSTLIRRGFSVNASRKMAMLVCALCVVPVAGASVVSSLWVAVILVGLAAAAHQGFSANLYTLVSDTVPTRAVSSVVGIGGMAGAFMGMCTAKLVGYVLQWSGNYLILFAGASTVYLLTLGAIHLINPRLEPMRADGDGAGDFPPMVR